MQEGMLRLTGGLIFVIALSIDLFVAIMACGANQIRILPTKKFVIDLVGTLCLGISLVFSKFLECIMTREQMFLMGNACLILLGIWKLLEYRIKHRIKNGENLSRKLKFSLAGLHFILTVYGEPEKADRDQSHDLSAGESIILAVTVSLDCMIGGLGANGWRDYLGEILLENFIVGMISILAAEKIGNRLSAGQNRDITWISGVLLIGLAAIRMSMGV